MAQNENLKAKILKEKNAKSAHPVRRCGPKETSTAPKAVESSKLTQKESTIIVRPTLGTLTHKDQDRWIDGAPMSRRKEGLQKRLETSAQFARGHGKAGEKREHTIM